MPVGTTMLGEAGAGDSKSAALVLPAQAQTPTKPGRKGHCSIGIWPAAPAC